MNIGKVGVVINNNNVMVPLKITAESLGFKVSTAANNKVITLDNDQIKTEIEVGVDSYYYSSSHADGCTAPESFGAAFMLVDNVVYVPIKIYNLLFNDTNAVESFFCMAADGKLVYVNNDNYTIGEFVESKSNEITNPIKEFNKTIQVNGKSVNLEGDSSNLVNLATYKINDMSYSISVTNEISENDITKIIKSTF